MNLRVSICLLVTLLLSSCATSRPYTNREKYLFKHAIAGQTFDTLTTAYALENENLEEGNPLITDVSFLILVKTVSVGLIYLIAEIFPDNREFLFKATAIFGYGAGCWNTGTMIYEEAVE